MLGFKVGYRVKKCMATLETTGMHVLQWSPKSFHTFFSLFNAQTGYGRLDTAKNFR